MKYTIHYTETIHTVYEVDAIHEMDACEQICFGEGKKIESYLNGDSFKILSISKTEDNNNEKA